MAGNTGEDKEKELREDRTGSDNTEGYATTDRLAHERLMQRLESLRRVIPPRMPIPQRDFPSDDDGGDEKESSAQENVRREEHYRTEGKTRKEVFESCLGIVTRRLSEGYISSGVYANLLRQLKDAGYTFAREGGFNFSKVARSSDSTARGFYEKVRANIIRDRTPSLSE